MPALVDTQGTEAEIDASLPKPAAKNEVELKAQATEPVTEGIAESKIVAQDTVSIASPVTSTPLIPVTTSASQTTSHKRNFTRPIVPIIPIKPINTITSPRSGVSEDRSQQAKLASSNEVTLPQEPSAESAAPADLVDEETNEPSVPAEKAAPKSWAELLRSKAAATAASAAAPLIGANMISNGVIAPKANSLSDAVRLYDVNNESKISFLKPRGLVNTGNMCYMNSVSNAMPFLILELNG